MYADNDLVVLHLSLIPTIGPETVQQLFARMPSTMPRTELYRFSVNDMAYYGGFTQKRAAALVTGLADTKVLEQELNYIARGSYMWITYEQPTYPALLKTIHSPPLVLYIQGAPLNDQDLRVAVIGARKANDYGQSSIRHLIPPLVTHGFIIVSGGALGADTMAHQETLRCNGKTIAILGSGLMKPYPMQNVRMFNTIIESGGSLISPFPLTMQALAGNFPARNRIISGMSKGCVVVQAARKSGASITAHYALDQGRDVFAVPGPINDELSEGCHALIQQGAYLATSAHDIMQHYIDTGMLQEVTTNIPVPDFSQSSLQGIQKTIWESCARPTSIDELLEVSGIGLAELQGQLFTMQLEGLLEQHATGAWQRV